MANDHTVTKPLGNMNRKLCTVISNYVFLHDPPWISPWIKSISNELDITCHVFVPKLSGHCDVINNRLWRHQKNVKRASETRGWCVKSNSGNKYRLVLVPSRGLHLLLKIPGLFYMLWVMYSTETCHSDIWRPQEPSGLWIKWKHGLLFVI